MLEFAMGLAAGLLLWPWWAMSLFVMICIADVVLLESNSEGWATTIFFIPVIAAIWLLNGDAITFDWSTLGDIALFGLWWLLFGICWSLPRAYFFLVAKKKEIEKRGGNKIRTHDTYLSNNKDRIYGWIVFWPLSIIGYFFGDFLSNFVDAIMDLFGNVYTKIENQVFKGWTE